MTNNSQTKTKKKSSGCGCLFFLSIAAIIYWAYEYPDDFHAFIDEVLVEIDNTDTEENTTTEKINIWDTYTYEPPAVEEPTEAQTTYAPAATTTNRQPSKHQRKSRYRRTPIENKRN